MFAYEKPEQKKASKSTVQKKEAEKPIAKPNLTGIPDSMKTRYENLSGLSFNDVRVHYNSDKPAQLQALAYTQGNQVYVAPGQEKHLGHELGHVVQQKKGIVPPTMSIGSSFVNDDDRLEKEADSLRDKVAQMYGFKEKKQNGDITIQLMSDSSSAPKVTLAQVTDYKSNHTEHTGFTDPLGEINKHIGEQVPLCSYQTKARKTEQRYCILIDDKNSIIFTLQGTTATIKHYGPFGGTTVAQL